MLENPLSFHCSQDKDQNVVWSTTSRHASPHSPLQATLSPPLLVPACHLAGSPLLPASRFLRSFTSHPFRPLLRISGHCSFLEEALPDSAKRHSPSYSPTSPWASLSGLCSFYKYVLQNMTILLTFVNASLRSIAICWRNIRTSGPTTPRPSPTTAAQILRIKQAPRGRTSRAPARRGTHAQRGQPADRFSVAAAAAAALDCGEWES